MIFLTVGTQLPFDRLVAAVDRWAFENPDVEVFGQIAQLGRDNHHPRHLRAVPFLDSEAYESHFAAARCIVAHAGTGTIIKALMAGKPILIMPRRAERGEQRNDHQVPTAAMFAERPGVSVAKEAEDVPRLLDEMLAAQGGAAGLGPYADDALLSKLRSEILNG